MFSKQPTSLPVLGLVGRKFVRAKPLTSLQEKEKEENHDPIVHFRSMIQDIYLCSVLGSVTSAGARVRPTLPYVPGH